MFFLKLGAAIEILMFKESDDVTFRVGLMSKINNRSIGYLSASSKNSYS